MHSRMLQDAKKNEDAIITEINPEIIRADLAKKEDKSGRATFRSAPPCSMAT